MCLMNKYENVNVHMNHQGKSLSESFRHQYTPFDLPPGLAVRAKYPQRLNRNAPETKRVHITIKNISYLHNMP